MTCRMDLHVHTNASMDGISTLEEQAAAARAAGLDAIAITDHNLCTSVPEELDGVLLIPGCEVSTRDGHITGLFLDGPLDLEELRKDGLPTGAEAVEEIRRRGGIAVFAHPFQSTRADADAWTFRTDGVEIANARAEFKVRGANQRAAELALRWGVPALGGSDAHSRHEVGNAYTEAECDGRTLLDMKAALLGGRCRAVLVRRTAHLRKGLSQMEKARRKGGVKARVVGLAYLLYCAGLDLLRR